MDFLKTAKSIEDQIITWRRDIHMHPELGFEEVRTSRLVADTLREMGIEAEVGVGITGVVGHIGSGAPVVGIRADMDALPITEEVDVPWKSQNPGVMHACGHDAHTAILLGVAKMLNEMPDRPRGEIRLLFQPSEEKWDDEGTSGATAMIADRALEGVDNVIALHVSSMRESGVVEIAPGYMWAATDTFEATLIGEGCHGASPHTGIDPIFILGQVINAIQGIRARRLSPLEPSVVTIGSVHGGTVHNVIPDKVTLTGTLRSYNEKTRGLLYEELERALAVSRSFGGDYTLKISRGYPSLYNDPGVADLIRDVSTDLIGDDNTAELEPGMGAEDFSYMTQKAPGAMFYLGVKADKVKRPHHSPIFDISEDHLHVGAAVLAETAVRLLKSPIRKS